MLKKIVLGIVVGVIVLTTSAGFLYAYQKESNGRQNYNQQSNVTSKNDADCTNQDCINNASNQNCSDEGDCINCQNLQNSENYQNGQRLQNRQENRENCTGTCLNNSSSTNKNRYCNSYNYKNQNSSCNEFNMQNMSRNRFKSNQ